jgi:hypothetical protein
MRIWKVFQRIGNYKRWHEFEIEREELLEKIWYLLSVDIFWSTLDVAVEITSELVEKLGESV